ncbi:molybdenum ABC transporter ATP-binding protein [Sphingomonas sp. KR1UV-12]|uniref:Molybdenum ABC transporter ATP-binding protein n=1 Tax=Sphingomonas aurea TaxID=3063994 RepID=A0ABT9EMH7_9SPHN|nr:molybdenum ABC transporter ATP-binding protein [Sphingomonas sp. KR1UV-12]MDP1028170.1 molybdenum ABC transporter ATP-binding protein [Sphingomonas sp. KR1UV-12]
MIVEAVRQLGAFRLDLAFEGPADGVTVLFGPSGAGKSATLAVVAGLARPERGRVMLGERVLTDTATGRFVPAERRRIGLVHQDARLFPHLNVERNLRYGLTRARGERRIGWDAVVEVLAIGHLLLRSPRDLSGGERQRVAIGRALLSQPELLLLDEPVSALDAARRAEVLAFVGALKARFGLPMLYVTHAVEEARLLGDHVVMIADGLVTAQGSPAELLPERAVTGRAMREGVALIDGVEVAVPGLAAPEGAVVRVSW